MAVAAYPPAAAQMISGSSSASCVSAPPPCAPQFAFARIRGAVYLVHCAPASSPLLPQDVSIFRHEFASVFRYQQTAPLHPADFAVLEPLDERAYAFDPDSGALTLSRPAIERLRKFSGPAAPVKAPGACPQRARRVVRGWNSALS